MTVQTPAPIEPPAPPTKPLGYWVLLTTSEAWREADRAYQRHHCQCPQCKAAGRGARYAMPCPTGAALYAQYIRAGETATAPLNPTKGTNP